MCGLEGNLGELLKEVKGGQTSPEYYPLCLHVLGNKSVEEIVRMSESLEENKGEDTEMDHLPNQRESELSDLFKLVSLDRERSLQTDFWIFLTVVYYLRVLEIKNFFTDLDSTSNGDLSYQMAHTGLLMLKTLRVLFIINNN